MEVISQWSLFRPLKVCWMTWPPLWRKKALFLRRNHFPLPFHLFISFVFILWRTVLFVLSVLDKRPALHCECMQNLKPSRFKLLYSDREDMGKKLEICGNLPERFE